VLLSKGAKVYIAARSQEKSQKAIDELKETGKESVSFLKLDLADLVSIKAAAEEFIGKESELHGLYNNAYVPHTFLLGKILHILMLLSGVMNTPPEKVTEQGYDMQFGTNVLGVCIEVIYITFSINCRSLLPHQVAPACSQGDREELSCWDRTNRQCGLYRSL
jgi:NAD(P)-dependent dehydrogenase (short-subunit alcohol dehydrogenase family)